MSQITYIPIELLHPHPDNPRKDLGDLTELAESIKARGVLQNLTVVDDDPDASGLSYTVIIGHRRVAAAKLAGLKEMPCVVAEMDPKEQLATMLLENIQRSDLTPYEQAQGFQLMINLGDTVETIAKKTGFSQTTVRRRIKMAELDPDILRDVSNNRQISLGDFDKLAKIESIETRNRILKEIGTADFNRRVELAAIKELGEKKKPEILAWLKEHNAIKLKSEDRHSDKYETYPGIQAYYIYFSKWGEDTKPKETNEQIYYYIDDDSIWLKRKRKLMKSKAPESQEEKERKKAVAEAWKRLDESAQLAYNLRKDFIENLTVTQKNYSGILYGAVLGSILKVTRYNNSNNAYIYKLLGLDITKYDPKKDEKTVAGVGKITDEVLPMLVYAIYGDGPTRPVKVSLKAVFPEYEYSAKLGLLYQWLKMVGYEMSADELQLLDGTHEAYHAEEAFTKAGADASAESGVRGEVSGY